jgi:transposase InsO family protein
MNEIGDHKLSVDQTSIPTITAENQIEYDAAANQANVLVLQNGKNYKISCLIGFPPSRYVPQIAVVDTGAGPNLIHKDLLPPDWICKETAVAASPVHIKDANGRLLSSVGMVQLPCQVGGLTVATDFIVVERLAVPLILGCDFIDQNILSIRPKESIIELRGQHKAYIHRGREHSHDDNHPVKVARRCSLNSQTETNVLVTSEAQGLCFMQSKIPRSSSTEIPRTYLMSNGLVETRSFVPFIVRVANLGKYPIELNKGTVLGTATSDPDQVIAIIESSVGSIETSNSNSNSTPITWKEDVNIGHLNLSEQQTVVDMLSKHAEMWNGKLGEISVTKHRIELVPNARPVYQAPYRAGKQSREIENTEVQRMLKAGVIEPANSEWASPVVLITKKDGSVRFCVDYRKLNALTVKDTYPLPRMDECLDSLGDAVLFTTLDCNSGYWQIPVTDEDKDKTAFVTHCGVHRFTRMPFGLCNAPATFQRALDMLLAKVKWKFALVYLDDVIIYSRSLEDHLVHVDYVLRLLRNAGISLKLQKCNFFQPRVDYLGHVVTPGKLAVAEKNIDTIRQAKYPQTRTELRSFLGMCNVYRKFVPHFAKKAAPLTELLKKGQPTEFDQLSQDQAQAFKDLSTALTKAPILTLPRDGGKFTLDVDASDYQIGACLLQEQANGKLAPCGYYSKTLNPAERNYSAVEKECLAVVWAVLLLRPYLERVHFLIRSDQVALRWLLDLKDPSGRLARWRLRLAEYNFEIIYRPGIKNSLADGCSRLKSSGSDKAPCDDAVPCFVVSEATDTDSERPRNDLEWNRISSESSPITLSELEREQKMDAECIEWETLSRLKQSSFFIEVKNGLSILCRRASKDGRTQLCIPKSLRSRLLNLNHYPATAGHPGGKKMYQTMRKTFYWPGLSKEAYEVVKRCTECIQEQLASRPVRTQLKLFPSSGPLEFVAIDILGPLPKTNQGHQYLLVISDRFTKLVRTIPLRRITSLMVAQSFSSGWVYIYGPPQVLLSDNGTQFNSRFFKDICGAMGIKQVFTSAYHPQTNGQVERFNRTILAQLRAFVGEDQSTWDLFSPAVTYAYNTQVHSSTGFSPFDLVLSRPPPPSGLILPDPIPGCLLSETSREPDFGIAQQGRLAFATRLRADVNTARLNIAKASARYKANQDTHARTLNPELLVGKLVFVRREVRRNKLEPRGAGPYLVIEADDKLVVLRGPHGPLKVSLNRVAQPIDYDRRISTVGSSNRNDQGINNRPSAPSVRVNVQD